MHSVGFLPPDSVRGSFGHWRRGLASPTARSCRSKHSHGCVSRHSSDGSLTDLSFPRSTRPVAGLSKASAPPFPSSSCQILPLATSTLSTARTTTPNIFASDCRRLCRRAIVACFFGQANKVLRSAVKQRRPCLCRHRSEIVHSESTRRRYSIS